MTVLRVRCYKRRSTEFTKEVAAQSDGAALPALGRLLHSPRPDVREQCAWALGRLVTPRKHKF